MKRFGAMLTILALSGGLSPWPKVVAAEVRPYRGGGGEFDRRWRSPAVPEGCTRCSSSTRQCRGSRAVRARRAYPGSTVNGPNNTGGPVTGLSTTQPSDTSTVGRAPGVNPANPQDAIASRQPLRPDRSTGARNPQDMKGFDDDATGVPQIMAPEK